MVKESHKKKDSIVNEYEGQPELNVHSVETVLKSKSRTKNSGTNTELQTISKAIIKESRMGDAMFESSDDDQIKTSSKE